MAEAGGGLRRSTVARLVRGRTWPAAVWAASIGWGAVLFATVRSDYLEFRLARYDLGNMVQAVWSTAHGRPLEVTDASGEQIVRLAGHVDPILVLVAPLWIAAPTPLTLAAVQVAAVALGALPLFWLGRRHLGSERAAGVMALAYLASPWLAWNALDAFHPVTLAIPLFLYAIWFLDSDRLWAFAVFAVLAALTGELMGLAVAGLGLWLWLARKRPRAGLVVALAGAAWTVVAVRVVVPAFRGAPSPFYGIYAGVGGSPEGVVETALTDPGAIVAALTSARDLLYIILLAAPLLGVFLLAPGLAAVALPGLAANLLSDWSAPIDPRHHYSSALLPFLFAASVLGLAGVSAFRRIRVAAAVLLVTVSFALVNGPWTGVPGLGPSALRPELPGTHVDALRSAVALVPDRAAVSATNTAASHLSGRRYVYGVPVIGRASWIALDTWDTLVPKGVGLSAHPDRLRAFRLRIERNLAWSRVFERDGVLVFRRVPPS